MQLHYLLIAKHLTGDSEVHFFPTADDAMARFTELTEPLLAVCRVKNLAEEEAFMAVEFTVEAPVGRVIGWRFNSGEDEDLDALIGEVNTYFLVKTVEVADDVTHYVLDASEYVDESDINFYNEATATEKYQALVTECISILNDNEGHDVDVFDEKTWNNDEGMTLFDGHTENECYFGFADVTSTVRLGSIPDFNSDTWKKIESLKRKFSLDKTKIHIGYDPTPDTHYQLMNGNTQVIITTHDYDKAVAAIQAKIDACDELKREGREPEEFIETHNIE